MRLRDVFASVDIHNNTGLNPHYGCVTALRHASLHLAAMFSRTVVYLPIRILCNRWHLPSCVRRQR